LIDLEIQRQTPLGIKIKHNMDSGHKSTDDGLIVTDILKRIIYSGLETNTKFLLLGFPENI
jgi:adenylate kinase family enzyme